MNILITNFHLGHGGGHYTYITYLMKHINTLEFNMYLAVPERSVLYQDLSKIHTTIFAVDFPSKFREILLIIKNIKKLKNIIQDYNIDVIHTNGNPDHKIAMWCTWFYRLNIKIIRTKHNLTPINNNFFNNKLYGKYTNQLITVSKYQYNQLNEQLKNKTTVIHNGIDLEKFIPQSKNQTLLQKYNIKDNDLVFVSVAGTALHKGWQYLVKAVSLLNDDTKNNIKIVLAGHLPPQSIIEQYVLVYNMEDIVVFTGLVKDVRDIISIGDIGFVLSTDIETISFACREMMAMGKPVIVSNLSGLPENIDHDKDGWIVQKESVNDIYNLLQNLPKYNLQDLQNNAVIKANNEFGIESFIKSTCHIYINVQSEQYQ